MDIFTTLVQTCKKLSLSAYDVFPRPPPPASFPSPPSPFASNKPPLAVAVTQDFDRVASRDVDHLAAELLDGDRHGGGRSSSTAAICGRICTGTASENLR